MSDLDFYYSVEGHKVPLRPSEDILAIAYRAELPPKNLEKLIRSDDRFARFIYSPELKRRRIVLYKRSPAATVPMEAFAARLAQYERIAYVSRVYYLGQNPLLVTDEFFVAFKPDVSRQAINKLNVANQVELIEELTFPPNRFLLRVKTHDLRGALDMVNRYFETGLTEYAEPNFIRTWVLTFPFTPNDPLFPEQWHLPRIQAPEVWDVHTGDPSVVVAILDDGIDLDHEDFDSPGKFVHEYDFLDLDDDPSHAPDGYHGTPVAGLAAADGNNSTGVTGVAPGCRIMPLRLICRGTDDNKIRNAFRHAADTDNGAAVINNSWGYDTRNAPFPLPGWLKDVFDDVTNRGRGGKGCIIFFGSGNWNINISEPATRDGITNYGRVIAVAACNDQDRRSGYSNFGENISICAPSDGTSAQPEVWRSRETQSCSGTVSLPDYPPDGSTRAIFTTDRIGDNGINRPGVVDPVGGNLDYTGRFGGTSAACPVAAGVAALMLSVASDLTWRQVRYILEATADKIDAANADPVGQYQVNGHSQWYGYGRVNAFEAVKGARSSVPDRDFVHRVTVTLRRTAGDRFVSDKVIQAIDARRRQTETASTVFVRGGPDGFLRTELHPLFDEVEVDG